MISDSAIALDKLAPERPFARFRRGDADGDGAVDIADPLLVLNDLFMGRPQPACADAADVDDSGALNIADPIIALIYLFLGQVPPPPAPGPHACGVDSTMDILVCADETGC